MKIYPNPNRKKIACSFPGLLIFGAVSLFLLGPAAALADSIPCNYGSYSCSASDTSAGSCPSKPAHTSCTCTGNTVASCSLASLTNNCVAQCKATGFLDSFTDTAYASTCCAPGPPWGCFCNPPPPPPPPPPPAPKCNCSTSAPYDIGGNQTCTFTVCNPDPGAANCPPQGQVCFDNGNGGGFQPTFSINITPFLQSASNGQTATYAVNFYPTPGYTLGSAVFMTTDNQPGDNAQVSCPTGAVCSANELVFDSGQATVNFLGNYVYPTQYFSITPGGATPLGNYNITASAQDIAGNSKQANATLADVAPPVPAADLKVSDSFSGTSNSDGPITTYYGNAVTLSWSSSNTTGCVVNSNANSDNWTGTSSGGVATSGLTADATTYTLSCIGPGGSVSDQVTINTPPAASNPFGSCPAPGTTATLTWTAPPGFSHFYVRALDLTTNTNVDWNEDFTGTSYNIPNNYPGTYNAIANTIPGHTYSWWVHTRYTGNGAYSQAVGTNFSCSVAVCPAGSVTLSSYAVNVGQSVTASAPAGWSGGSYNSSNSGVASVSGSNINGVAGGTVQVSGFGWNAPNGATNCNLSNSSNLTVSPNNSGCPSGSCGGAGSPVTAALLTCPSTGVSLSWQAGGGATSYNIYRNTHGGSPVLLTNPGNVLSYNDSSASVGTSYDYWVEALSNGIPSPNKVGANTNGSGGVAPGLCAPGAPSGGNACNANTSCSAGGILGCGLVRVIWTDNSANEQGFHIYEDGVLKATAPGSSPAGVTGGVMYSDIGPLGDANPHTFTVSAYNAGGDSSQVPENNNQFAAAACGATTMADSDKDIVAVNGSNISPAPSACNAGTDALPAGTTLVLGQKLTFRINLCTDQSSAPSKSVSVTDTMNNIQKPSAGWNAYYCQAASCSPITPSLLGNILTFSGLGDIPAGHVDYYLLYDAQLTVPVGTSGYSSRFNNAFNISYQGGSWAGQTPWLPFSFGKGSPTIIEVP